MKKHELKTIFNTSKLPVKFQDLEVCTFEQLENIVNKIRRKTEKDFINLQNQIMSQLDYDEQMRISPHYQKFKEFINQQLTIK